LPVDGDDPERAGVAEKLDGGWKTTEPRLAVNPYAACQRDLDIWKWPERIEDVAIWAWRDGLPGAHAPQAKPANGYPAVGIQLRRRRAFGVRDRSANVGQTLSDAEHHVLLTKDQARCCDEAVQLVMASQYENASATEGQPAGGTVGKCTSPLDPLAEQASDVGQHDVLVPLILQCVKFARRT
jgi:hypothetical protein